MTIQIVAVMAEQESRMISERTRAVFASMRSRGVDFSRPQNRLSPEVVSRATLRARACLRGKLAQIVHDAATRGDWRAAAFILERRDPNAWGRNARIAIDGEVSVSALTMEQRVSAALAAVSQRSREEMEAVIDRAGLNRGLVRPPEGEGL